MRMRVMIAVALLSGAPLANMALAQVNPGSQGRPTDQQLSDTIAKSIANDPTLSADAIKVSVNGGVASLTGVVGKESDKAKAVELARITGIIRVENHLTSREKAGDKAKDAAGAVGDTSKKAARETKNAASKTGEAITDGWISTRIKGNFAGEQALKGSDIKVNVKDHLVTLTGTVPDATAHARALTIAKEVEGVDRVVDNLKIGVKAK